MLDTIFKFMFGTKMKYFEGQGNEKETFLSFSEFSNGRGIAVDFKINEDFIEVVYYHGRYAPSIVGKINTKVSEEDFLLKLQNLIRYEA